MDNAAEKINYILVNLINEVWVLEEKAIITDEFKDITNNDMHVIEAIGLGDGSNMSSVARKAEYYSRFPYHCHQSSGKEKLRRTPQKRGRPACGIYKADGKRRGGL